MPLADIRVAAKHQQEPQLWTFGARAFPAALRTLAGQSDGHAQHLHHPVQQPVDDLEGGGVGAAHRHQAPLVTRPLQHECMMLAGTPCPLCTEQSTALSMHNMQVCLTLM
jgi:hypothetical protein